MGEFQGLELWKIEKDHCVTVLDGCYRCAAIIFDHYRLNKFISNAALVRLFDGLNRIFRARADTRKQRRSRDGAQENGDCSS